MPPRGSRRARLMRLPLRDDASAVSEVAGVIASDTVKQRSGIARGAPTHGRFRTCSADRPGALQCAAAEAPAGERGRGRQWLGDPHGRLASASARSFWWMGWARALRRWRALAPLRSPPPKFKLFDIAMLPKSGRSDSPSAAWWLVFLNVTAEWRALSAVIIDA